MESLDQRIKSEKVAVLRPVVFAMRAHLLAEYCSYCHNWLTNNPYNRVPCPQCEFVWYCSAECREKDVEDVHQYECQLFTVTNIVQIWKSDDLEMPDSDRRLAILRLVLKWYRADLALQKGTLTGKTIMEWPDVAENGRTKLQIDEAVAKLAQSTVSLLSYAFPLEFEEKKPIKNLVEALIRKVYCRLHCLFAKHSVCMLRVGVALDLDLPFFTKCCGPNAEVYWSGRLAYVVPFFDDVKATSLSQVAISPVEVTLPKALRRTVLEQFGVIGCECERCTNKMEFDASLKCQFCDASQVQFDLPRLFPCDDKSKQSKKSKRQTTSKQVYCGQCQKVQSEEYVNAAVKVMHEIGQFYYASGLTPEPRTLFQSLAGKTVGSEQWTCEMLQKAEKYLCPVSNLFYFQLLVSSLSPLKSYEPAWMQRAQHYFRILSFWVPPRLATGRSDVLQFYTEMLKTFAACHVWDAAGILLNRVYSVVRNYFVDNQLPRDLAHVIGDIQRDVSLGLAHNVPLNEEQQEEIERSFMATARDVEAREKQQQEQAEAEAIHSRVNSLLSRNDSVNVRTYYWHNNNNVDDGLEDSKITEILNSLNLQSVAGRQSSASGAAEEVGVSAKRGQAKADAAGQSSAASNASKEGAQNGDLEDGFLAASGLSSLSALSLNENALPKKSSRRKRK